MNRRIALVSTIVVAFAMLSVELAPAMAKPNVVTVIVKNTLGDPVKDMTVWLRKQGTSIWSVYMYTDSRGKVSCDVSLTGWASGDVIEVSFNSAATVADTSFMLNRNLSNRVTIMIE